MSISLKLYVRSLGMKSSAVMLRSICRSSLLSTNPKCVKLNSHLSKVIPGCLVSLRSPFSTDSEQDNPSKKEQKGPKHESFVEDHIKNESTSNLPYHLCAAICVERLPILTPELAPIQKKMMEHLQKLEYEQSLLNDHELRHKEDLKASEALKKGVNVLSKLTSKLRTALDDEDEWKKEHGSFKAASRTTGADAQNDLKSLQRALDRPLRLLVKQNYGNEEYHWDMPTMIRLPQESLRETAERTLRTLCGENLDVNILGNCPWGFYQYKYPKRIQRSIRHRGQKVFIYKAHYISGQVELKDKMTQDFSWLVWDELATTLDKFAVKALEQMVHTEDL